MKKMSLAAATLALLPVFLPCSAEGSEAEGYETTFHPDDVGHGLVRDLVRVFISEAGFEDRKEWSALGYTIARRARRLRRTRGWDAQTTLRTIADRTLVEPATDRQRWLHAIDTHGGRPEGWNEWTTARWNTTRSGGLKSAVDTARDLVRGDLADPCDGPSELWGSRVHPVDRSAIITGLQRGVWALVDCDLEGGPHDNVYVRWTTREERRRRSRSRSMVEYID